MESLTMSIAIYGALIFMVIKLLIAISPILLLLIIVIIIIAIYYTYKYVHNDTVPQGAQTVGFLNLSDFEFTGYKELYKSLNRAVNLNETTNLIFLLSFIPAIGLLLQYGIYSFTACICIAAVLCVGLKIFIRVKFAAKIEYSLSSTDSESFHCLSQSWKTLFDSSKVWRIVYEIIVANPKANAGIGNQFGRAGIKYSSKMPFYLKTNSEAFCIKFKGKTIIFLPDILILFKNSRFYIIDRKDVDISAWESRYTEIEALPSDAHVLSNTWQYVNKNGSPDLRYKNNFQVPVCLYGFVEVKYRDMIYIKLMCSNHENISGFNNL